MIAQLEVVKGMELTPQACILCANNPVDEITGKQQKAIFAPGVDVNWGDSVYICWSCVQIMADLAERVTQEGFDKLETKYNNLKEKYEVLKQNHERAEALLSRVRDGGAAAREIREEVR